MNALFLLLPALAFGHGGEDHGAPAPPIAAASDAESLSTWSTEFEAVVRLPYAPPGEAVHGTALVADFNTSAPVEVGQISLSFTGPAALKVDVPAPSQPGVFPLDVTFPAHGTYAGGLTVISADRADVLGLPPLEYAPPAALVEANEGWGWGWIAAGVVGGIALGVLIGVLAGFGAGRITKWGAPVLLIGGLGLTKEQVSAHGGEDHSAAPAPAGASSASAPTAGGGLTLPMESQFLLKVRTVLLRPQPMATAEPLLGRTVARPGGGADLMAPLTGVVEFPSELVPGMPVVRGQVLAVIRESLTGAERADVLSSRTNAQTELARAKRDLALAERDADRADQLGGVLSERERFDRKQTAIAAREAVRQAEIAASGIGSTTTPIVAPVAGRLGSIAARPGEVVQQGAPLFTVQDDGPLWVEAQLPEEIAGRLVAGAEASITLQASPGEVIPARVLDPGLAADPSTGMFRVTLELPAMEGLRAGMGVTGWVTVGEPREVLAVADEAIIDAEGQPIVFVKTGPEAFEARSVGLGAASAGRREVVSGLHAGERVVVAGTYALRSMAGR